MSGKMIPDQDDPRPPHESFQIFQESHQTLGIEAIRFGSSQQPGLLAIPSKSERGRHRNFGPVIPARLQDRRFPARGPRAADGGLLRDSGFVLEEDPGLLLRSVFFSSGQRTFFQ